MFRLRPEHTAALAPRAADVRVARLLAMLRETGLVAEHDAGASVVLARDQRVFDRDVAFGAPTDNGDAKRKIEFLQ